MPALVTPFDQNGEVDTDAHRHNVALLGDIGIEGFVLGGSNGEGPYLEPGERAQLVASAREAAPHSYLMLGIVAETVRQGLRQLEEAEGADSVLVLTPTTLTRNKPQFVVNWFRHLADASSLPVFLYSVPPKHRLLHAGGTGGRARAASQGDGDEGLLRRRGAPTTSSSIRAPLPRRRLP